MAKELLKLKVDCQAANKNKNGSNLVFAANVKTTEKGELVSRTGINIVVPDTELANKFSTTGKGYTITITED